MQLGDDDGAPPAAGAADELDELEPGQELFELLSDAVSELPLLMQMQLAEGLRAGDWAKVPPHLRALYTRVEDEFFVEGE